MPSAMWDRIQDGVMQSQYRGVPCYKSPFDLGIYLRLFSRLQPRTVVEIGSKFGGSALFFADLMSAHGTAGNVISIDIESIADFEDPRIRFIRGNALALESVLPSELAVSLPRPLLVIEDSAHQYETCMAVLNHFDAVLNSGDYMVIEDGIVATLTHRRYRAYKNGPNRAITDFLTTRLDRYLIDSELCDLYGFNVTYNPNGWLRRR